MQGVEPQREIGRDTWWIAAAILSGIFSFAFGMFAVLVAIPKVMTAFGTDVSTIQWIMTGYLIAHAVPAPAMGWLVSRLGKRQLFMIGVIGISISSILCGLAWSIESLILFRILLGAFSTPVWTVGTVLIYEAFPSHRRGLAMGLVILISSLGPTLGQFVGGYLVDLISWRAIFFLALPSGVASLFLTFITVPRDAPATKSTIDFPGLISMTGFLVALLLALSQGQREGWDSSYILSLWALAAVLFSVFVVTQLTVKYPVVHLRLYRHFGFVMASVVVFLYNAGFMGANFLVGLMLQVLFEFTPIQAGYILAPGAAVMGLFGLLSGRFSDRFDPRWLLMAGLLCFVVNMVCFASLTLMASISVVTLLVIFQRSGLGLIQSAINTAVMRTLPESDRSMGSGLHNLHRGIGMSFGVAFCSMLLEKRLAVHSVLLGQQHDRFALSVEQALSSLRDLLIRTGAVGEAMQTQAQSALQHLMNDHVRVAAYTDCFAILAFFFLCGLLPVWFIRAPAMRRPQVRQVAPTPTEMPREGTSRVAP